MNAFRVVKVTGFDDAKCQIKVETGTGEFTPIIKSWYVREPGKELEDLPNGSYLTEGTGRRGEMEIRRNPNTIGSLLGSIRDMPVVKVLKDERVDKRRRELTKQTEKRAEGKTKEQIMTEFDLGRWVRSKKKEEVIKHAIDVAVEEQIDKEFSSQE